MQNIPVKISGHAFFVAVIFLLGSGQVAFSLPATIAPAHKKKDAAAKPAADKDADKSDKTALGQESKEQESKEIPIENVINVTTTELVEKPQNYLNKNVKFTAKFASISALALDYKPAFRSSRNYFSFLVFRPDSHVPYSELKLAMLVPKEKDPITHMLGLLKENDLLEITGHVFACPLDEPWLDVLKLKKLSVEKKGEGSESKEAVNDGDSEDESPSEKK